MSEMTKAGFRLLTLHDFLSRHAFLIHAIR